MLGVLTKIGWDFPRLAKNLLLAVFTLVLLFVFIFMGVKGFATTGSFGAVINSVLPISAGGVTELSTGEALPEELKEKIQALLKSNLDDMIGS